MASPRESFQLMRSPPSSRTSLDTSSQPSTLSRATNAQPRRDRAALRDYYRLKAQQADGILSPTNQSRKSSLDQSQRGIETGGSTNLSSIDYDGFDAGSFVHQLLETEALEGLLTMENELVSDIRNLDGERKALVYDNYSKLITATDTIKKMRSNMDPLSPATSTLSPAIAHIAETSASLAQELTDSKINDVPAVSSEMLKQRKKAQWILEAPRRLEAKFTAGRRDDAEKEWLRVQAILKIWNHPPGSERLIEECQSVIDKYDPSNDSDHSG
jgi:hypothetical protein